jgi:hypothetical protein
MTTSANQSPFPVLPTPKRTPGQIALTVGAYTKCLVLLLVWGVVGSAALGATYVALMAIWWGIKTLSQPLH